MSTALVSVATSDRARRTLEVTAAVAVWIAVGLAFHMTVSAYQLTGLVLIVLFQIVVRRQPLRALWVRDAPEFWLDARGWLLAALLALCPLFHVVKDVRTGATVLRTLAHLVGVAGAFPAAYALRKFQPATARALLGCLAIPGVVGILMQSAGAIASHTLAHRTLSERLWVGVDSFFLYIPIVFVFEEVSFRGALDSHIHHQGEPHGWLTALWVSILWGLWHVPVTLGMSPSLPRLLANNVIVCCIIGVPFSLWWRRCGNLAVPGVTHALIDAVRNALLVINFR